MRDNNTNLDVVAEFWEGIRVRNWAQSMSVIGDKFERVGMRHGGPDTIVGRANYQAFLEHIVPTFTKWHMEATRITWSADGNSAVAECVETIQPTPDEDVLIMHELVDATIGEDGRISKLDLYFKIPDPLPQWVIAANSRKD
ncbi:nuclear transport factor 2 family protein [Mycobacterium sp.]|uniref:nuclear transport factor 2 family protein n=1 Tax=Mycobacterium sp. TaxID=1785 RepID=UPI003BB0D57F